MADMLFIHYGRVLLRALERLEAAAPGLSAAQLREKKQQQRQGQAGAGDLPALREALGLGEGNKNVSTTWLAWYGVADTT